MRLRALFFFTEAVVAHWLLLHGPQGSGKGTQVKELVKKRKLFDGCVSDILDVKGTKDPSFMEIVLYYKGRGEKVPTDLTMGAVVDFMAPAIRDERDTVLDGVRGKDQVLFMKKFLHERGNSLSHTLLDNLDIDTCLLRIRKRVEEMIRLGLKPRKDDLDPAVIRRRLEIYFTDLVDLRKYLESCDEPVTYVDARQGVQAINQEIIAGLDPHLANINV